MSNGDKPKTTGPFPVTPQQKAAVKRATRRRSKKPRYVLLEVPESNFKMLKELLKLGGVEGKVVFVGRPGDLGGILANEE